MKKSKCVITIATGNPYYLDLASNLARSFICWHDLTNVGFQIITDLDSHSLSQDLDWVDVIRIAKGSLGIGFSTKLQLDRLAPSEQTLFLDADCLICGSLEPVFNLFKGHCVGVVGSSISEGEWFGNIEQLRAKLNLGPLPKFNGGLYYLEPGECCSKIYSRARNLEPFYDDIGLVRLRGRPNDELLMSIALSEAGIQAMPDDGTILGDPQACPLGLKINVSQGTCVLVNPPPRHRLHQPWYPVRTIRPLVVHFLAYHTDQHPYRTQVLQLLMMQKFSLSPSLAWLAAELRFGLRARLIMSMKRLFRPLYRFFFGTRAVQPSKRAVA